MYPSFWRPDPTPPQGARSSATLPAAVGDNPPFRGPLLAAVLGAIVAWPAAGEPQPDRALLRTPPSAVPWVMASEEPPPRPPLFGMVVTDGVYHRDWLWIPQARPSPRETSPGLPTPDIPPPRAQYQTPAQTDAWTVTWDAQRIRHLTPPSGPVAVVEYLPYGRPLPPTLAAWFTPAVVELPLVEVPQDPAGDQPPKRVPLAPAILPTWVVDWPAQRGPQLYQPLAGDQPRPYRRLAASILDAWQVTWDAQRAACEGPPVGGGTEPNQLERKRPERKVLRHNPLGRN